MQSILTRMLHCPLLLLLLLLLFVGGAPYRVVAAATTDIVCDDISSPLAIVSADITPSVRFLNCTRDVMVSVPCGVNVTHPMAVEVSGGTTVPRFTFVGCSGAVSFVDVVIRGVMVMPLSDSATDRRVSPPLLVTRTLTVLRVSVLVLDSLLVVAGGINGASALIDVDGAAVVSQVNVTIRNSTIYATLLSSSCIVTLKGVRQDAVWIELQSCMINVTINPAPAASLYGYAFVLSIGTDRSEVTHLTLRASFMTVVINAESITYSITEFFHVGPLSGYDGLTSNASLLLEHSHVTVRAGRAFHLVALTGGLSVVNITADNCTLAASLLLVDASMTTGVQESTVLLASFGRGAVALRVGVAVGATTLAVAIDTTQLSAPIVLPLVTASIGCSSMILVTSSPGLPSSVIDSSIVIIESSLRVQMIGALSMSPSSSGLFGLALAYMYHSFVVLSGGLVSTTSIVTHNCTIHTSRLDAAVPVVMSPSVERGAVLFGVATVALLGQITKSAVAVTGCTVTSSVTMFTDDMRVSAWNTIGCVASSGLAEYLQAELPALALVVALILAAASLNHSTVSVSLSTLINVAPILPMPHQTSLRVSVAFLHLSAAQNVTTHIINSTLNGSDIQPNISASILLAYSRAAVWLAPTSIVSNTSIVLNGVALHAATLLSASGIAQASRTHLLVLNCTIEGISGLDFKWDAIRLAPVSSIFQTTLTFNKFSMQLSTNAFVAFRSLFGNLTATQQATPTTTTSPPRPNELVWIVTAADALPALLQVVVPTCMSNTWDDKLLQVINLFPPTVADGQPSTNNVTGSIVTTTGGGPAECDTAIMKTTSRSAARMSAVTTSAMVGGMLFPTASAATSVPLLQGLVGVMRISARCTMVENGDAPAASSDTYAASDVSDNPLRLRLPSSVVGPSLAYATGALLGNTALVVIVGALSHCLHRLGSTLQHDKTKKPAHPRTEIVALQRDRRTTQRASYVLSRPTLHSVVRVMRRLLPSAPLPASLTVLYGLLLEPTIGAAMSCVVSEDRGAASVVVALIIGLLWLGLPCLLLWLLCVKHAPLPLLSIATRRVDAKQLRWQRIGRALEWLCAEREEWVLAPSKRRRAARVVARGVKQRLGLLFEGLRGGRHWYFGIDALLGVLTGAVVGLAESVSDAQACAAAVWGAAIVGIIAALSGCFCLVLRPFVVRFEIFAAVSVSGLAVLVCALSVSGSSSASGGVAIVAAVMEQLPIVANLLWWGIVCNADRNTTMKKRPVESDAVLRRSLRSAFRAGDPLVATAQHPVDCDKLPDNGVVVMQQQHLKELLECICGVETNHS
jgi:hypothetical protein